MCDSTSGQIDIGYRKSVSNKILSAPTTSICVFGPIFSNQKVVQKFERKYSQVRLPGRLAGSGSISSNWCSSISSAKGTKPIPASRRPNLSPEYDRKRLGEGTGGSVRVKPVGCR